MYIYFLLFFKTQQRLLLNWKLQIVRRAWCQPLLSWASEMYLLIAIEEQDWVTTAKKFRAEPSPRGGSHQGAIRSQVTHCACCKLACCGLRLCIIYGHPDCLETQGAAIQLRKGKLRKTRLQPNSTVIVVEKLIACLEVACDSNVWVCCVCFGLNNPLFTVLCLMCPISASFFSLNFPSFKVFPPSLQTLHWPRNIWSKHGLWAF